MSRGTVILEWFVVWAVASALLLAVFGPPKPRPVVTRASGQQVTVEPGQSITLGGGDSITWEIPNE